MQALSFITNPKGEQEGILINYKDLKRLNLKVADVIAMLKEQESAINAEIEKSKPAVSMADALGKLKGKLG